jgi:predicted secreted protein
MLILKTYGKIPIMGIKGNSMLLKKIILMMLTLLLCVSGLWAGDVASFVDLGFSADGRIYMFGQYGVLSPSLKPWAEIYIVDMRANNFVPNGKASLTEDSAIKAGQDGSGTFYKLVGNNTSLANKHGINFQNQGLPLYISRDENPPANGEKIDFRDFISGKSYIAELVPYVEGSGQNVRSSFYINLESRTQSGQVKNYTIGTPQVKRSKIVSYNMKRVIIDAGGESIIFVIEMKRITEGGYDIRYMVEAQRL